MPGAITPESAILTTISSITAATLGITVREMHRRGVANLDVRLEAEAVQLRDQLRRYSKPDVDPR